MAEKNPTQKTPKGYENLVPTRAAEPERDREAESEADESDDSDAGPFIHVPSDESEGWARYSPSSDESRPEN